MDGVTVMPCGRFRGHPPLPPAQGGEIYPGLVVHRENVWFVGKWTVTDRETGTLVASGLSRRDAVRAAWAAMMAQAEHLEVSVDEMLEIARCEVADATHYDGPGAPWSTNGALVPQVRHGAHFNFERKT